MTERCRCLRSHRVRASTTVFAPWHVTQTPCRFDRSFVPPSQSGTTWSMLKSTGILYWHSAHLKSWSCTIRKRACAEKRFRFIFF
jgi:hypothetical protein